MYPGILDQVKNNCPRDLNFIKNTLSVRSNFDTISDIVKNGLNYSYCAIPIVNGVVPRADIIVGFVADTPTTFTYSVGNQIAETKSLKEGEIQYAFYGNVFPYASCQFNDYSISNVNGSGYIICANVDDEPRMKLLLGTFMLGEYVFITGIVVTTDYLNTPEGKRLLWIEKRSNCSCSILDLFRGAINRNKYNSII
jgi:hypothetical protein